MPRFLDGRHKKGSWKTKGYSVYILLYRGGGTIVSKWFGRFLRNHVSKFLQQSQYLRGMVLYDYFLNDIIEILHRKHSAYANLRGKDS